MLITEFENLKKNLLFFTLYQFLNTFEKNLVI
jgi:hypothetical protein